jgi:hypothetical protein
MDNIKSINNIYMNFMTKKSPWVLSDTTVARFEYNLSVMSMRAKYHVASGPNNLQPRDLTSLSASSLETSAVSLWKLIHWFAHTKAKPASSRG